jgi:hypothetical protein
MRSSSSFVALGIENGKIEDENEDPANHLQKLTKATKIIER